MANPGFPDFVRIVDGDGQPTGARQQTLFSGTLNAGSTGLPVGSGGCRAAVVALNVTEISGAGASLAVKLQGVNADGLAWDIPGAAFAAVTAPTAAPLVLLVALGCTPAANAAVNFPMPLRFVPVFEVAGTNPEVTFTLDVDLV